MELDTNWVRLERGTVSPSRGRFAGQPVDSETNPRPTAEDFRQRRQQDGEFARQGPGGLTMIRPQPLSPVGSPSGATVNSARSVLARLMRQQSAAAITLCHNWL